MATATDTKKTSGTQRKTARAKPGNGKSASGAARKPAARKPAARKPAARKPAASSARSAVTQSRAVTARDGSSSESSMPIKMAKSALVGLAGSVAIGAATRAASRRPSRTRVLGVVIPKELKPENLASGIDVRKLSGKVDYKDLLKRIGDAAEAIEARSDDVRMLSAQAKRLSRKLS